MTIGLVLHEALEQLRRAGYNPSTVREARADAAAMLGTREDSQEVAVFLFGQTDTVRLPGPLAGY